MSLAELDESIIKRLPRYPLLPATLLDRLAVDVRHKGKRLLPLMLIDALKKSLLATVTVASLAVIVEAINEAAASFYRKYGFQEFKSNNSRLYLPMQSIAKLDLNIDT